MWLLVERPPCELQVAKYDEGVSWPWPIRFRTSLDDHQGLDNGHQSFNVKVLYTLGTPRMFGVRPRVPFIVVTEQRGKRLEAVMEFETPHLQF